MLLIGGIYLLELICAAVGLRKYSKALRHTDYKRFEESDNMAPSSVRVPVCNKAAAIADNTRRLLVLDSVRGRSAAGGKHLS